MLRNNSRRAAGVPFGTIDALLAQLATRQRLTVLSTDSDFETPRSTVLFAFGSGTGSQAPAVFPELKVPPDK